MPKLSRRLIASRLNGARGGRVTAMTHSKEEREKWGEKAGAATLARYGEEYYSYIRRNKTKKRRKKAA